MYARGKHVLAGATALLVATLASGCGNSGSGSDASPTPKEFLVDTGAGGGSDIFAREIEKILGDNHITSAHWPVRAITEGDGLGLMAYLRSHSGKNDEIAAFTSKWMVEADAMKNAPASIEDTTPIAELADETQLVAVPTSLGYTTLKQLLDAGRTKQITLVGGSAESVSTLAAVALQQYSHTSWKYLFFHDNGSRISALLRGDAQVMVDSAATFAPEVKAGKLRILAALGAKRVSQFPDAPTLHELGIVIPGLPDQLQFRGIAGPPNMPPKAVKYYQGLLAKMVKTDDWKKYMESQGDTTDFITGDKLTTLLKNFDTSMAPLIAALPEGQ